MEKYNCYYYQSKNGRCLVEEFIESLSEASCRQYFAKVNLLETFGHKLPMPHAKKIESKEKIYELRFNDKSGIIRVLYFFFEGNNIIFTNVFVKKTQKTPKKEIEIAIDRKKMFLSYKLEKRTVKKYISKVKKK